MNIAQSFANLWTATGIYAITGGELVMIGASLLLIYLAIAKNFEPLLLRRSVSAESSPIFR